MRRPEVPLIERDDSEAAGDARQGADGPVARRDVFISHASEGKDAIARPLAECLRARGCSVWFDEYEPVLGDSHSMCQAHRQHDDRLAAAGKRSVQQVGKELLALALVATQREDLLELIDDDHPRPPGELAPSARRHREMQCAPIRCQVVKRRLHCSAGASGALRGRGRRSVVCRRASSSSSPAIMASRSCRPHPQIEAHATTAPARLCDRRRRRL
jgi:TIR domain